MRFEKSIEIDAPQQRVWDVLSALEAWPQRIETVDSVELLTPAPITKGSRVRLKQPKLPEGTWDITAWDAPSYFECEGHPSSDGFWRLVTVRGMEEERFESLEDMSRSADLVGVGRITSIEAGREWVASEVVAGVPGLEEEAMARFVTATIEFEEILGSPTYAVVAHSVALELFVPPGVHASDLIRAQPVERSLFFLRNKGPDDSTEFYRLVNTGQGLFREGGGLAHAPVDTPSEGFVAEVDHLGFDSLVASVSKILGQGD